MEKIRHAITSRVFVPAHKENIAHHKTGGIKEKGWIFDFRRVILEPEILTAIVHSFWNMYRDADKIQIGGLESASLPLIGALAIVGHNEYEKDVTGFFIRKSRKRDGLMRMIEGTVHKERPIVLVDDAMNSAKTFIRQIEVLEELGYKIDAVWSILRFRDTEYYEYFHEKGIRVESLFCLDDFSDSLEVKNVKARVPVKIDIPYKVIWKFASDNPSYFLVVPKSDPTLDEKKVYFGSDSGVFWARMQEDGALAWSRKVGFHPKGKGIFSSPIVSSGVVYFGAYDGNVYALDTKTGKPRWIFFEADWIGSSPALSKDLGLLFVGLEFGLIKKRGGIAAIDIETGKKKWQYDMPMYTHSSPLYIEETKQVVIGSNDGSAYLFNAKDGTLIWKFETGTYSEEELVKGFSQYDIKESFAYDKKHDYIIFGNIEGMLYVLERKTGKEVFSFKAEFGFYSTPLIYKNKVYASSIDKHVYCIDLDTFELKWKWSAGARIFASPVEIEGSIYIGANTGRLTELDPETGKELSFLIVPERITNRPAYNPKTKRFFVPTFANEIYCLEKKETQ